MLVDRVQVHEVRIVGIGVIAGEQARFQFCTVAVFLHIEPERIIVVFANLSTRFNRQADFGTQSRLLLLGGLGRVIQRVEGWPVGVGGRALRVVGVVLVGQHRFQRLGHEHFGGVALLNRHEATLPIAQTGMLLIECHYVEGLPLAPEDVGHCPATDIGAIQARRMARPGRNRRPTVE